MAQGYEVSPVQVVLFAVFLLTFFVGLLFYAYIDHLRKKTELKSPYTAAPLFSASLLPFESKKKIVRYLQRNGRFHNRPFLFSKAFVCRQTGRVFSDCANWLGIPHLNWSFIQKRCPGVFVSWGSLSEEQKSYIYSLHESLEGFQTVYSSRNPLPKNVGKEFVLQKPGPLYVDLGSGVLIGWQQIPETELEVLIVQKPKAKQEVQDTLQKSRKKQSTGEK